MEPQIVAIITSSKFSIVIKLINFNQIFLPSHYEHRVRGSEAFLKDSKERLPVTNPKKFLKYQCKRKAMQKILRIVVSLPPDPLKAYFCDPHAVGKYRESRENIF